MIALAEIGLIRDRVQSYTGSKGQSGTWQRQADACPSVQTVKSPAKWHLSGLTHPWKRPSSVRSVRTLKVQERPKSVRKPLVLRMSCGKLPV